MERFLRPGKKYALEIVDFNRVIVRSQALREAKARGRLPFVTIPTKNGAGLMEVLSHDHGLALYGAFVLLARAAADMEVRGLFARHGRPLTTPEIARLAMIPTEEADAHVARLIKVGWLRFSELNSEQNSEVASEVNSEVSSDGREGKRSDNEGRESTRAERRPRDWQEVTEFWTANGFLGDPVAFWEWNDDRGWKWKSWKRAAAAWSRREGRRATPRSSGPKDYEAGAAESNAEVAARGVIR
ncbi:MAG TPA: hypothetical protein PLB01_00195 [Thermoanaerobaculia bacterium]|nr:hypothetical protein [Thermoanaerobaculia bacterium]